MVYYSCGSVVVQVGGGLMVVVQYGSDLVQFVDHAWHVGSLDSQWALHTELGAARAVGAAAFVGCGRNSIKASP